MAASVTLTLTAATTGRMPGCFRASALTASCLLRINSGAVALMPHAASGFTAFGLSCLGTKGTGNGPGQIAAPQSAGEQSGIMAFAGGTRIAMGVVGVIRTTGSTEQAVGGSTQV